jgi:hypothetical protein
MVFLQVVDGMPLQAVDRTRQTVSRGRVLPAARHGRSTFWRWSSGQTGAQNASLNSDDDGQAV